MCNLPCCCSSMRSASLLVPSLATKPSMMLVVVVSFFCNDTSLCCVLSQVLFSIICSPPSLSPSPVVPALQAALWPSSADYPCPLHRNSHLGPEDRFPSTIYIAQLCLFLPLPAFFHPSSLSTCSGLGWVIWVAVDALCWITVQLAQLLVPFPFP